MKVHARKDFDFIIGGGIFNTSVSYVGGHRPGILPVEAHAMIHSQPKMSIILLVSGVASILLLCNVCRGDKLQYNAFVDPLLAASALNMHCVRRNSTCLSQDVIIASISVVLLTYWSVCVSLKYYGWSLSMM